MLTKNRVSLILLLLIFIFLYLALQLEEHYLWISFGFIIFTILLVLVRFERGSLEAREIVLLAILAAIAAVARIPFASIPSVQPTTFIIMMSGLVFGAQSGFLIGLVAALASNMILGQGPWTPWQMAAWGMVGLTAGMLRNTPLLRYKWGKVLFAIIWGFLFGWIMNLWGLLTVTGSGMPLDRNVFLTYFAASALFDTMHAASNVFFLLLFGDTWIKILSRFKKKYGLLYEV
ncbi:ECF transporter S component [Bacillus suaedaesalsae]|uniref:ECF transporter S component n=1 Tax=Bacillus suaedaesalsae TaxID=2810349 RepID=A0ABS2DN29_9BACI|nr:ECF transporter S component [Bacillus suaedaesalsae]MBM6619911.1 ECF transporter S component [Bacillus suaedaesalsae]